MAAPAILLLENEKPLHGVAMGFEGVARGVMATCALASGFPDLLTDPVYGGKMVCFTYPHVGNAGVVPGELQGDAVAATAVVAREFSKITANRLGVETMDAFLKRHRIPAIEDVDTRTIAEIVTRRGNVRAVLGCGRYADADALAREFANAAAWTAPAAGTSVAYDWRENVPTQPACRVVVCDLGVKRGFLRRLAASGCAVRVLPANSTAIDILAEKPDGVVFSAGPGVPADRPAVLAAVHDLLGKLPLWGVGLGAGILAEAAGAKTTANARSHLGVHPVGRDGGFSGEMTVQCHEFWIDPASLAGAGLNRTHFNLNDGSVEGFASDGRRVMGVLFHPEAEPGPRDSLYLFERFRAMMNI